MPTQFQRVAILGLGAMGGAFAKLIKKKGIVKTLIGYDSDPSACQLAQKSGLFQTVASSLTEFVKPLDLVIVCTPIHVTAHMIQTLMDTVHSETIITDIASIKTPIIKAIKQPANGPVYIPGHPMAGTEKTGLNAAGQVNLDGARYILVKTDHPGYDVWRSFLDALGFQVLEMDSQTHDKLVGYASHLPYLMACLTVGLTDTLDNEEIDMLTSLLSTGFCDTTRVAGSSVEWGTGVLMANKETVNQALTQLEIQIKRIKTHLEGNNEDALKGELEKIKHHRERLLEKVAL